MWDLALGAYPSVIALQGVVGLEESDRWYRDELPRWLASRMPPFLRAAELVHVVEWKMRRGEWLGRNLALAKRNSAKRVETATAEAFRMVPQIRPAIDRIGELEGVGPATASAVLAAFRGDLYPFLDDVIGRAIPELGTPKFTALYYVGYSEALRGKAQVLGSPWTAQGVGLALWAAAGGKVGLSPAARDSDLVLPDLIERLTAPQ